MDIYEEHEAAEALAVSWRDKHRELNKMQRNRKFSAATDLKKSYRVEIEELKRRTRCHKCQKDPKVGHWSREYKEASKGKGPGGGTAKGSDSGAACVQSFQEQFIAAVGVQHDGDTLSILRQMRARRSDSGANDADCDGERKSPEILRVSSPRFGVIDSGCGRMIIGRDTLEDFKPMWNARGIPLPQPIHEINHFKFENGQRETSDAVMKLPVVIAGKSGIIKAALVQGHAPLLISRGALQSLRAVVDFGNNQMQLFDDQPVVPLQTNEAGQYVINVLSEEADLPSSASQAFEEVMMNQPGLVNYESLAASSQ